MVERVELFEADGCKRCVREREFEAIGCCAEQERQNNNSNVLQLAQFRPPKHINSVAF